MEVGRNNFITPSTGQNPIANIGELWAAAIEKSYSYAESKYGKNLETLSFGDYFKSSWDSETPPKEKENIYVQFKEGKSTRINYIGLLSLKTLDGKWKDANEISAEINQLIDENLILERPSKASAKEIGDIYRKRPNTIKLKAPKFQENPSYWEVVSRGSDFAYKNEDDLYKAIHNGDVIHEFLKIDHPGKNDPEFIKAYHEGIAQDIANNYFINEQVFHVAYEHLFKERLYDDCFECNLYQSKIVPEIMKQEYKFIADNIKNMDEGIPIETTRKVNFDFLRRVQ